MLSVYNGIVLRYLNVPTTIWQGIISFYIISKLWNGFIYYSRLFFFYHNPVKNLYTIGIKTCSGLGYNTA